MGVDVSVFGAAVFLPGGRGIVVHRAALRPTPIHGSSQRPGVDLRDNDPLPRFSARRSEREAWYLVWSYGRTPGDYWPLALALLAVVAAFEAILIIRARNRPHLTADR